MRNHIYNTCARLGLSLLLLAAPAAAQLKVGDDLGMSLNGQIGAGYDGNFGNTQLSSHNTSVNGDLNLTGYFYNPNFLNFFARPIYNRSQANSGDQSITDTTSINTGAGIFSGSHFPGSVSFGKSYNGTGTFGLPEVQGFTTHGDATHFGIGWSELLPKLPPVTAQYQQSTSTATLFGTNEDEHASTRDFNLGSSYNLDGWMMTARFNDVHTSTKLPSFVTTGEFLNTDETSKTFFYNANHRLPLKGSAAMNYSYGSFRGEGNGLVTSGSDNIVTGTVSLIPWSRWTATFGTQYDSDLNGAVEQQLFSAGAIAPQVNLGSHSHSLSVYNFDSLNVGKGVTASFGVSHTDQVVYNRSLSATHFSAVVNYHFQKPLWGSFTVYTGVNDQSSDAGHQGTGLVGGVNFDKRMLGVEWGASFSYAQNVQTILTNQVTSSYSYLANAKKRMGRRLYWVNSFHGFHSGLSDVQGLSNHSEGYSSNLSYRNYALGASFSRTYGTALITATGLVAAPGTIPTLPGNQYLLVNGSSYGINVGMNPVRRWTVAAAYSRAINDTKSPVGIDAGSAKVFTTFTQLQFRKISAGGGYTRLEQGLGATAGAPPTYSSFYVGIQRWFHPF